MGPAAEEEMVEDEGMAILKLGLFALPPGLTFT